MHPQHSARWVRSCVNISFNKRRRLASEGLANLKVIRGANSDPPAPLVPRVITTMVQLDSLPPLCPPY